jgi:uncharacterized damage-inducible protein DinB
MLAIGGSELQIIIDLYEYNSYVRKKYLKAIFDKIPEEERYKDRGTSFPTIVDIFVHMIDNYRFWFLYVYPHKIASFQRLRGEKHTLSELAEENEKIDSYVLNFIHDLKPSDLNNEFSAEGRNYGTVMKLDLRQMLIHMIEEELQHIGEMNALFWQMDIEPPITEYMDWVYAKQKGLGA